MCLDETRIILLDQTNGFSRREFLFGDVKVPPLDGSSDVGSQYCAWNSSGTLLAATSDMLNAVIVWDVATGSRLYTMTGLRGACLPVSFAPWDDRLVIFGEATHQVRELVLISEELGCSEICLRGSFVQAVLVCVCAGAFEEGSTFCSTKRVHARSAQPR